MTITQACCNTPATITEWTAQGILEDLPYEIQGETRKVYRVGNKTSKRGIVALTDPFGLDASNSLEFFDRLAFAGEGYQLAAPDLFPQGTIPSAYLGDMEKFVAWLHANMHFHKNHIDKVTLAAVEALRADGCTEFYLTGSCMGTYSSVFAASEPDQVFLGLAGPHPTRVTVELVKDIKCPVLLMPTKTDPDLLPVVAAVNAKGFKVASKEIRFDDCFHGFTGSRGSFRDAHQLKRALDVINVTVKFFDELSAENSGVVVKVGENENAANAQA